MDKTFSAILKQYQADWGYKNAQMSNVLGISERMFAYYEKGDYDGNVKKVNRYLQKLSEHERERKTPGFNSDNIKASSQKATPPPKQPPEGDIIRCQQLEKELETANKRIRDLEKLVGLYEKEIENLQKVVDLSQLKRKQPTTRKQS